MDRRADARMFDSDDPLAVLLEAAVRLAWFALRAVAPGVVFTVLNPAVAGLALVVGFVARSHGWVAAAVAVGCAGRLADGVAYGVAAYLLAVWRVRAWPGRGRDPLPGWCRC